MNPLVSIVLITLFIILAIGMVISITTPVLEDSKASASLRESEMTMKILNDYVQQVSAEGNGSTRKLSLNSQKGEFRIYQGENSIVYSIEGIPAFQYLSRSYRNGFYSISGNDVKCYESGNYLFMENSRINISFQKVGIPTAWAALDTKNNINSIYQKNSGITISLVNSSTMIDENALTSIGNGYSEIMKSGQWEPECIVHFFVNSSEGTAYDEYYILFAGADFIFQEIGGVSPAKTITFGFATHINTTDLIRVNETNYSSSGTTETTFVPSSRFISANSNGTAFGVVSAGLFLKNISLNTSYPGSDYLFQVRQLSEGNRILIVLSNGTWSDIDSKMLQVDSARIIGTTFGDVPIENPTEVWTYLFAFYRDINLTKSARIGLGNYDIFVKNIGKINNITNVEITVG
jgi:hypothetical protein